MFTSVAYDVKKMQVPIISAARIINGFRPKRSASGAKKYRSHRHSHQARTKHNPQIRRGNTPGLRNRRCRIGYNQHIHAIEHVAEKTDQNNQYLYRSHRYYITFQTRINT